MFVTFCIEPQCNACGVRMKKGRLAFVDGQFVPVESAAAAAKRIRALEKQSSLHSQISKPKRRRRVPKHLEVMETVLKSDGLAHDERKERNKSILPAAVRANPPPKALQTTTDFSPRNRCNSNTIKPSVTHHGLAPGLYFLLAAIEFIETK